MPIVAGIAVLGLSSISGAFLVRYLTVHPLQMSSSLLVTSLAAVLAVMGLVLNFQGAALLGMGAAAGLAFAVSYWITTKRVLARDDERPVPTLTRRKDDPGLGHTAVVYFTHGEPQTYDPIGWLNQFREFDEQKIPFIPVIARPIFIYMLRRKYLQVGMSQHRQNHQRMIKRLEESFRADGDLTTKFYLSFLDDNPRPDAALIQALNDGASRVAVAEVFVSISNHTAEGEHQIASVQAEEYGVPIGLSGPLWDSATLHSMFVARANAHLGDTAKSKVGIVLVGHGQPDEWDVEFPTETEHEIEFRRRILAALEADGYRRENMDLAWMEFKDPKPAEKIEHLIKNGVEKILYFSAAISAESIHSQFDIPDLVSKAKVPVGFPIINLGAWNDDPIVIQAIKEKIVPLLPERYFISTSDQLDYAEVER